MPYHLSVMALFLWFHCVRLGVRTYILLAYNELDSQTCSICRRSDFKIKKMKIVFGLLKN